MAEDLQGLLNRIQTDGLKKAEDEKSRIIAEANAQAKKILDDAKEQAAGIVKEAQKNAEASEAKAKSAIQQAARDITIALKTNLLERLQAVTKDCIDQSMNPAVMGQIIQDMAKAYAAKHDNAEPALELLLQKKDQDALESQLKSGLLASLKNKPVIELGSDFGAGLKIGFKGSDVFFDFSDEALSEIICEFVGPKLAALIKN